MKNQILKTIKGLKRFTIEDVEQITGFDESDIIEVIKENCLKQVNGVYIFEPCRKEKPKIKSGKTGKNIMLKNFAARYIETLKCSESTKKSYEIYLRLHINPYFRNKRVIDINSADIDNFRSKKLQEGLSNKSINNFVTLLYGMFEYGISQDLILINPCRKLVKLKTESKKQNVSKAQLNNLLMLACQEDFGFYTLLQIAIDTGLSRGKILELKWSDVDLTQAIISGIKVDYFLLEKLKKWNKICPMFPANLVFPNKNGNKIHADNMIKRKFKPLCIRAGLKDLRFIDLKNIQEKKF